jgi:UDP-2,4-diacetamido-2,4,6-trideoxy-beta-L-altropyranose hydrolase
MKASFRSDEVLFRVAGGPRVGFGHVLRSLSLARALGVQPRLSLRGGQKAAAAARALGARQESVSRPRDLDPGRTRVLVVDDPSSRAARPWVQAARAQGIRAISVHDLGRAPVSSDLAVDGSVAPGRHDTARHVLLGPKYAVLDPRILTLRGGRRRTGGAPRILVSLGGGVRTLLAARLAQAIGEAAPHADVRLAAGFVTAVLPAGARARLIAPKRFRSELARATAAVLAGGVSLYEACALGVPTVAISVVPAQMPTVRAFGQCGAAVDAGPVRASEREHVERAARRIARTVALLLQRPEARRRLSRAACREVDGRGALRVAAAIRTLHQEVRAVA